MTLIEASEAQRSDGGGKTLNTNKGKMLGRNKDNDRLAGYDVAEELGRQLIRTREKRWWRSDWFDKSN